jgi:thioredoxin 1
VKERSVKNSTRWSIIGVVVAAVVVAFYLRHANRPAADVSAAGPGVTGLAAEQHTATTPDSPGAALPAEGSSGDAAHAPAETPQLPRLVDLGRGTCRACKMMAPILTGLAAQYAGELIVEVIDLREDAGAARRYGIRMIPTQIFFDATGKERFRHEGFMSKDAILAKWQELGVELAPAAAPRTGQ